MATYQDRWSVLAQVLEVSTADLLERIADEVVADAKRYVPVDTGLLKSRIHRDETVDRTTAGVLSIRVHGGTTYAGFVELGTYKMRARPYLRPAVLKHRGR